MEIKELPTDKIIPSVFQPRETFEKGELQELADSMKEHGLINPISVKENGDGTYQIIAGERRWRAAKFAEMDKIYAIIREVTDADQRLESLIENVHRKDLNMIEKGRGMMEIFKIHGLEMESKVLAGKIGSIRNKENKEVPLDATEMKIKEISSKVHMTLRVIRDWLDTISVEPEVIKEHLITPEKERISDSIIARLSTIKDKELQKKTYVKIKEQDMGRRQASKFVTKIKQLKPEKQRAVLDMGIPIEIVGDITEKEIEDVDVEIPEKDIETIHVAIEESRKKTKEILEKPIVKERGKHRKNWAMHQDLEMRLPYLFCPKCGNPAETKLRWTCHLDMDMHEAHELAGENFGGSIKREKIDPKFMREGVGGE